MKLLYSLFLILYYSGLGLAAIFNQRAARFFKGRNDWKQLIDQLSQPKKTLWIHAASAGEFEQAIPVIEQARRSGIELRIVASFYSASGYEMYHRSNYADAYFHFPPDLGYNARKLVAGLQPSVALFIRNEIWWNTLSELKKQDIPVLLMNAEAGERKGWYGKYLRRCYTLFTKIFYSRVTGNTKTERVLQTATTDFNDPVLEKFSKDSFVLMLGSCYEKEVKLAAEFFRGYGKTFPNLKLVLCPHEWEDKTIFEYQQYFDEKIELYSQQPSAAKILFVDKKGILKYIYRYADAAFVGGGYGKGVHNVSEAAVYGIPVLTGPNHLKFPEITAMAEAGLVKVIHDGKEISQTLLPYMTDENSRSSLKDKLTKHFSGAGNASIIIWKEIEKSLRN